MAGFAGSATPVPARYDATMTAPEARGARFTPALSGAGFGITSGVLTTLGLIVGLHSGTNSRSAVAAGIATIAVADAFSDALGIHVSQESAGTGERAAWTAAATTFATKIAFALSFLVPVLILPLGAAVLTSIAWGLVLLTGFSWYIARLNQTNPVNAVGEHLLVAAMVIAGSQAVGMLISELSD